MKYLISITALMFIFGCGPKPVPPPKVMTFKIKGSTMSIKATLKANALYEAADLKKALITALAPLDNK